LKDSKILILGFAYKEDCSDTRNTPIYTIYKRLKDKVKIVDIMDPNVRIEQVLKDFDIKINFQNTNSYDAIIFAVPHKNIFSLLKKYTKNFKKNKNL
jgi:UDP-N-acetyl-D-galactosamine dehydrogenase